MTLYIETPLPTDILCGKDKTFAKHPGNRAYRHLIESQAAAYTNEHSKQVKMAVTKDIVARLEADGARFLRKIGDCWEEITNQQARDKTSHALRFCSNSLKKKSMSQTQRAKAAKHHRRTVSADSIDVANNACRSAPDAAISMFHRQQQILQQSDFVHRINHEPAPVITPEPALSSFRTSSRDLDEMLREPIDQSLFEGDDDLLFR